MIIGTLRYKAPSIRYMLYLSCLDNLFVMNIDRTRSKSSFSQQNQGIVKWDFGERK